MSAASFRPLFNNPVPQTPEEFRYFTAVPENVGPKVADTVFPVLREADRQARNQFGITTEHLPLGKLPDQDDRPAHVLAGPHNPLDEEQREIFMPALHALVESGALVSLMLGVPAEDGANPRGWKTYVKTDGAHEITKETGANILYPDVQTSDFMYVQAGRLVDDKMRRTVGVKYIPVHDSSVSGQALLEGAQSQVGAIVTQLHNVMRRRGVADDIDNTAVALGTDIGWLVSHEGMDPKFMSLDDFSLIDVYDPERNELHFAGHGLPSAYAPEMLMLGRHMRSTNDTLRAMIHFNHPAITNGSSNGKLRSRAGWTNYGSPEMGEALVAEYSKKSRRSLIMPGRGVVWVGAFHSEPYGDGELGVPSFGNFVSGTLKLPCVDRIQ